MIKYKQYAVKIVSNTHAKRTVSECNIYAIFRGKSWAYDVPKVIFAPAVVDICRHLDSSGEKWYVEIWKDEEWKVIESLESGIIKELGKELGSRINTN